MVTELGIGLRTVTELFRNTPSAPYGVEEAEVRDYVGGRDDDDVEFEVELGEFGYEEGEELHRV